MEQVVLVDEFDKEIGAMEKIEAHRQGALHRAFSIFLIDGDARVVLQQRHLANDALEQFRSLCQSRAHQ